MSYPMRDGSRNGTAKYRVLIEVKLCTDAAARRGEFRNSAGLIEHSLHRDSAKCRSNKTESRFAAEARVPETVNALPSALPSLLRYCMSGATG